MSIIIVYTVLIFAYSLVSGRLAQTVITAPIVFTAAGALALFCAPELTYPKGELELYLKLAEIGLVLLLFTDASRTDLTLLKSIRKLPVRLLSVGMLLTLALGALIAKAVFPSLSIWEAGILSAILAPTDAGLGQIIVNDSRVPIKIRQALNVEAGLNDGLSVPFLLFFMALAGVGAEGNNASLTHFIVEQLFFGAGIGAGIGLIGGWLLAAAHRRNWIAESWQKLGVVVLPLLCMLASEECGASMFIAAFVAGLAVQVKYEEAGRHSVEFTEEWGQLLNLFVFLLFGVLAARDWQRFQFAHIVYAVCSLTIVRMVPVAIALWGTRLSRATVLFMGWFGPRGLASIVLALVYLREMPQSAEATVQLAVSAAILISIFAHGLTAVPGIELYTRKLTSLGSAARELRDA